MPQQAVLFDRSVADNVLLPLQFHNIKNRQQILREALDWAGIGHLRAQRATMLSTGEQQMVALARARALSPKVLLLDEPSANLDPIRQKRINDLTKTLSDQCKIIMTTHSMQQARELASDILLLEQGKLVTHATAEDFFVSDVFKQFSGYE